jgi:competence protein ComEC
MATVNSHSPLVVPRAQALRATPSRPLLWAAVAVGVGAAADYCLAGDGANNLLGWWWGSAVVALVLAYTARRRGWVVLGAMLLLTAGAGIGGAWEHWRWNYFAADDLGLFAREAPQPACVDVVLAERVKISPPAALSPLRAMPARTMSEATVHVTAIRDGANWRRAAGQSRLRVAGELHGVAPGDHLRVFAQLGRQPPPLNPGQYDWQAAERREGRLCELYCDDPQCVTLAQPAEAGRAGGIIDAVRRWCAAQLATSVGERDAPLVLATLLGDQERLTDETKEAFLKTGSIHLLVISGAHVAMLAWIVWVLVRAAGFGSRVQLGITAAAILLYAAVVGHEPSVTRATILAMAMLAGLELRRTPSTGNLLGAAALVVLAMNPCELFRSGTQFSFLAVAALVMSGRWLVRERVPKPLAKLIAETRPWPVRAARHVAGALAAMTLVSLAVGAAVAPLVAYHFHVLTPASVLLTPLASPLVGLAIASGLAIVTVGWLVPPLAPLLGTVCGGALHGTEWLVRVAADVPGASSYCASPGAWWLCVLYGAGGLMAAVPALRPNRRWLASAAMAWAAVGYVSLDANRPAAGELRCTFLAVGHGTCAVMELPGRQTILYDAGSLGSPEQATQIIASYLWERGVNRIDAIVLSHADIDHYNAVPGLLERFPVGAVYVSPMMFDPLATAGQLGAPNYLRDVLAERGVPLREIWMNDRLRTASAEVTIDVLHPPEQGVIGRDNANSVLLAVGFAGRRILLPGDLESPGIERVMADPPMDCDVLLAPHHGSEQSDPPGFAAWSSPEWVVMSGRRPERTLTSVESYERVGAAVCHTALDGAVSAVLSREGVRVETLRTVADGAGP